MENNKPISGVSNADNAKLLWQPSAKRVENTNMVRFMNHIKEKYKLDLSEYEHLYQWSIQNIAEFWASMWEFAEIIATKTYDEVIDDVGKMPGAKWFSGTRLM